MVLSVRVVRVGRGKLLQEVCRFLIGVSRLSQVISVLLTDTDICESRRHRFGDPRIVWVLLCEALAKVQCPCVLSLSPIELAQLSAENRTVVMDSSNVFERP